MPVEQLVTTYFDQIEVYNTDCVIWADATHDVAFVGLIVPTQMLRDYMKLKGKEGYLPDGPEFWRETGLVDKLRNSGKYHSQGTEPLDDMLDFLGGEVQVDYQQLSSEKTRLMITEIPQEFYGDE